QPPVPGGELAVVLWLFHSAVEDLRAKRVIGDSRLTVLSFSDSIFLVTPTAADALTLSRHLMQHYIRHELPVQIGVGYGSFAPVRYRRDWTGRQNKVTAQFIGSGLVFAHSAHTYKAKGLRILLHASIEPHLEAPYMARFPRIPLTADEQTDD